jgi:glutathione S-transferase
MKSSTGELYIAVGTYREIRFPEKLVFTWSFEGTGMGETLVSLEFHERGSSTELVLTHELFPNQEQRDRHLMGWNGCLDHLAKFF